MNTINRVWTVLLVAALAPVCSIGAQERGGGTEDEMRSPEAAPVRVTGGTAKISSSNGNSALGGKGDDWKALKPDPGQPSLKPKTAPTTPSVDQRGRKSDPPSGKALPKLLPTPKKSGSSENGGMIGRGNSGSTTLRSRVYDPNGWLGYQRPNGLIKNDDTGELFPLFPQIGEMEDLHTGEIIPIFRTDKGFKNSLSPPKKK